MRISTGVCDEFRTTPELAARIISYAAMGRSAPAVDRVEDVRGRLEAMGVAQLKRLLEQIEQGKSQIIFPQIVRDLGLNFEVIERHAA